MVVTRQERDKFSPEARSVPNKILLQSTTDYLAIMVRNPTREEYLQTDVMQ